MKRYIITERQLCMAIFKDMTLGQYDELLRSLPKVGKPVMKVVVEYDSIDGFSFLDIDGRMKFLRIGDELYTLENLK